MDLARACLPFMEMGTACFPISVIQTLRLRASVHDLCVIPMAFESQGVLHENWEEIYHLFVRHWVQTHRADVDESQRKREASALVLMWTAHTPLSPSSAHNTCSTIGCFSTSLCKSRRNLRTLFVHQTRMWRISHVRVSLSWSRASSFSPSPLIEIDS